VLRVDRQRHGPEDGDVEPLTVGARDNQQPPRPQQPGALLEEPPRLEQVLDHLERDGHVGGRPPRGAGLAPPGDDRDAPGPASARVGSTATTRRNFPDCPATAENVPKPAPISSSRPRPTPWRSQ